MQKLDSPKLAWFALSLLYMYLFVLRVFPSVAEHELRTDLILSAAEFSSLGAIYLAAYGLLQIPFGSIVNRIGLKNVALGSIVLCILGGGITSIAHQLWILQLGRLLLGAGGAPVFMCALKICADHIPSTHRGLYMGITLTMGTFGALVTGNLVVSLIDTFNWRMTSAFLATTAVPILLLTIYSIPTSSPAHQNDPIFDGPSLKRVFSNKLVYIYGVLGLGLFASLNVFTDLWGTAYLIKRFGINRSEAASASMLMYVGLAIGSLLLPWYFSTKSKIITGIQICAMGIFVLFSSLLVLKGISFSITKLLLFCLGIFSGGIMLVFSGASFWTNKQTSGLTISVINTFNMFGGAILNQSIGLILNYNWDGTLDTASIPQYNLASQDTALTWVLGSLFLTTLILAFVTSKTKIVKKISK